MRCSGRSWGCRFTGIANPRPYCAGFGNLALRGRWHFKSFMKQQTLTGYKIANRVIIGLLMLLMVACVVYVVVDNKKDRSKWSKAYCQITKIVPGRSGGRKFVYRIGGKEYEGWTGAGLQGATTGDIFEVQYNPKEPDDYYFFGSQPVFLDKEEYGFTTGTVTYSDRVSKDSGKVIYYTYNYRVREKQYNRTLWLDRKTALGLKLQEGQQYVVKFSPGNPQRSTMLFDSVTVE